MKILHICFVGPYNEGWTYQENLLSKYHARLGHEVTLICTPREIVKGDIKLSKDTEYINEDGVHVIRMPEKLSLGNKLIWYKGVKEVLEQTEPDILFVHGPQFMDASVVAKYVINHPKVRMYVDNHCDYSNSATNFLSKYVLHKMFWKHCAQVLEPVTKKFYGVLPARVDFLEELYKLPEEKCELLVMGADDELVKKAENPEVRQKIRKKYHIEDDDFLIMTGGKIDLFKTQTILLMQAIKEMDNPKVKLIVFGSVVPELKDQINDLADGKKIQYIGWVNAEESYDLFAAAGLVVFPGRHSVFWEQVVGQGIPMVVKYWEGTTHVDCGGNVEFLTQDSVSEMSDCITKLIDPGNYQKMKKAALESKHLFLYSEIAKRSLE